MTPPRRTAARSARATARTRALLTLLVGLAPGAAAACGGEVPAADAAERVDSAGVDLVNSSGTDRPLEATLAPRVRLGGGEGENAFYRVGRGSVAVDGQGRIHVLDHDAHRVLVFSADGTHLRTLGSEGEGPGELAWPSTLAVTDDGTVMVHDIGKHGLVAWGPGGEPVEAPPLPEGFFGGAVAHEEGSLYLTVSGGGDGNRLVRVGPDGDASTLVSVPAAETRAATFESCGMSFSGLTKIFSPTLRWDVGGGLLAAATGAAYRVDLYRDGELVRSLRRHVAPTPATPELAERTLGDGMRVRTEGGERVCRSSEVVEQRGFEEVVPPVGAMTLTPEGGLWVQRAVVGEDPAPIDLFDAEGEYLGTLPAGTPLPIGFLPDGSALWTETDELDVQRLVVGRIEITE